MGSHAFHSHNTQCNEGYFFLRSVKNATSKKSCFESRMACTLSVLGRCFLILRVALPVWLYLKRSSARLEHGFSLLL